MRVPIIKACTQELGLGGRRYVYTNSKLWMIVISSLYIILSSVLVTPAIQVDPVKGQSSVKSMFFEASHFPQSQALTLVL